MNLYGGIGHIKENEQSTTTCNYVDKSHEDAPEKPETKNTYLWFHLFKVQKKPKLISGVLSQDSGYLSGRRGPRGTSGLLAKFYF